MTVKKIIDGLAEDSLQLECGSKSGLSRSSSDMSTESGVKDKNDAATELEQAKEVVNIIANDVPKVKDAIESYTKMKNHENDYPERDQWGNHCDFFLSCLGYAVGLGNIWRFPYLCYKHGGGSFLVPYLSMLFLVGLPLFFLELGLGQYASIGAAKIFDRLMPASAGIGWGVVSISFIVIIYYNLIIAWCLYYLYVGFTTVLPWSTCQPWMSSACFSLEQNIACLNSSNFQSIFYNHSCVDLSDVCSMFSAKTHNETHCSYNSTSFLDIGKALDRKSASEEYFTNQLLGLKEDSSWENLGSFQPHLLICLILSWITVFLCLCKGVRSSGKVVYFTALYPFVILGVFFVRGLTLPGAINGVMWYITPEWEKIMTIQPWTDAATQIFFSLGVCFGTLITFASYNKFKNNCLRDALLVGFGNCTTSIFSGFVVFSIVGYMAFELGQPVGEVIKSGPGLTFIVYPQALAKLPLAPLWSFLFFTMILTLGLDSQFGMTETVTSAVMDQFPQSRRYMKTVVFSVCAVCCIIGLPFCLNGGVFMFELINWYSALWSTLLLAVFEFVLVAWGLGVTKYYDNLREMGVSTGILSWYFRCTWKIVSPCLMLVLLVWSIIQYKPCYYEKYVFPQYIQNIGFGISALPFVPASVLLLVSLCKHGSSAFSTAGWRPSH